MQNKLIRQRLMKLKDSTYTEITDLRNLLNSLEKYKINTHKKAMKRKTVPTVRKYCKYNYR